MPSVGLQRRDTSKKQSGALYSGHPQWPDRQARTLNWRHLGVVHDGNGTTVCAPATCI